METKPFYVSRTMIAAAIVAVVPLIPGVGPAVSAWIAANPALFSAGLAAVFGGLRVVTKGAVSVS
jgi:hypothetical protein